MTCVSGAGYAARILRGFARMSKRLVFLFALAVSLAPSTARAGKYDVDLTPLGSIPDGGTEVQQDNAAFRSLSSEIGVLTAPKPVDPADTLGISGFAVSADVSINTISGDESFWTETTDNPNNIVPTLQLVGRKGLYPGIEIGGGATHVFDSKMWTVGGYAKIAFHEGFYKGLPYVPSIAVRGHFGQLLGSKDLKMTTVGVDGTISHVFGVGSTFNITPYVGYQALLIIARSGVLDATPDTDEYPDGYLDPPTGEEDLQSEFVFKRQDVILRHRPFVGVRFVFSVLRFGVEAMFVPGGSSEDSALSATDESGFQQQYTVTLGLDF